MTLRAEDGWVGVGWLPVLDGWVPLLPCWMGGCWGAFPQPHLPLLLLLQQLLQHSPNLRCNATAPHCRGHWISTSGGRAHVALLSEYTQADRVHRGIETPFKPKVLFQVNLSFLAKEHSLSEGIHAISRFSWNFFCMHCLLVCLLHDSSNPELSVG